MSGKKSRVLLGDDHPVVLEGLRHILESHYEIIGTARNGRDLLDMAIELRPDVVVTDISMPLLNGLDVVRKLRTVDEKMRLIVLTVHADPMLAAQALNAGAQAYVQKQSAPRELVTAVRQVLNGESYVTPRFAASVREALRHAVDANHRVSFTAREREVLQLLAEGYTAKEAAALLGISARTIEFHKKNVMKKTGLNTIAELARLAADKGLV